ncbi:MAG: CHC2 zinc finger domain-containing protein [Marinagarivorans sp.]|nr:CHC2 zinc finger domain-containing protein [Marinagarivorans sp.]
MARIPTDIIERIKAEVSLVRLAESQGYALEKSGKDFALCCPFHKEKTPSCKITPVKNLFNCLGCGVGGSNIDWYMQTERVSFRRAAEVLQRELGLIPSSLVANAVCATPSLPMSTDADDQELLARVVEFYRNTLVQSPEALDYLKSRGLDHPELISTFNLGFANRTLAYQLPHKRRADGAQQRGRLQD